MNDEITGRYAVTLEVEVSREVGAGILADYERYFRQNNIDKNDLHNSDVALYWKLVGLHDDLFLCDTTDEVNKIKIAFNNAREHIKEIRKSAEVR